MNWAKVVLSAGTVLLMASPAAAQGALQAEIDALREDVMVMQRQLYRDKDNGLAPSSAQDVAVRMGEFDETLRQAVGKMDELAFKVKALEERINVINKDIDVRFKMLEGKPVEGGGLGSVSVPAPKYKAPVAAAAPKAIVGDSIAKGDDLPAVKTQSAEEIYQQGLDAIKGGQNDLAVQKFTSLMTKYPSHKLAGNAQYWMGEAYYAKKDYAKAAVSFAKGYEKYKNGSKGADNILKLGMSMKELGKKDEACTAFINLPKEFPSAEKPLKDKAAALAKSLNCK